MSGDEVVLLLATGASALLLWTTWYCADIARGLAADAPTVQALGLPRDAPPAFLVDANRLVPGVRILSASPADRGRIQELAVPRPSRFRRAWYRVIAAAGLRRNNAGGFGGAIPTPSSGGGGFA